MPETVSPNTNAPSASKYEEAKVLIQQKIESTPILQQILVEKKSVFETLGLSEKHTVILQGILCVIYQRAFNESTLKTKEYYESQIIELSDKITELEGNLKHFESISDIEESGVIDDANLFVKKDGENT